MRTLSATLLVAASLAGATQTNGSSIEETGVHQ
jgi:hypothetical protein